MDTFLIYLLKTSICFVFFYISVAAFLSNETFFRLNRNVLLIGMAVCLLLPLVKITTEDVSIIQAPIVELENRIISSDATLEANSSILLSDDEYVDFTSKSKNADWRLIILIIYAIGILVNLLILLRSISGMLGFIAKGRKIAYNGFTLVLIDGDISPFSWKKYFVISESDYYDNADEIITHELAHIQHRHSLDIIYTELIFLFQWFNPVVWLLKKELRNVHEYQADISVIRSGIDATKYQLLLVKKSRWRKLLHSSQQL